MTNEQMANLYVNVDVHQWEQVIKHLTLNAIMRAGANGAVVIKLQKISYIKKDKHTHRNLSNNSLPGSVPTLPSIRLSVKSSDMLTYMRDVEFNHTDYIRIEFYDSGNGLSKVR